jgi:ATP-dependent Clp protease ATP-binding subunit ClpC
MFERYTESARRSLFFARYEASQLGSIAIAAEHLLLGLIRDEAALAALLPVDFTRLRREIEALIQFKEKLSTSVEIPFAPDAKRALQYAAEEADLLLHSHIGTEHLLLGVLRAEGSAAAALAAHGVSLGELRGAVKELAMPLAYSREVVLRMAGDQIKRMARALADEPPGSEESIRLVQAIGSNVDELLKNVGLS